MEIKAIDSILRAEIESRATSFSPVPFATTRPTVTPIKSNQNVEIVILVKNVKDFGKHGSGLKIIPRAQGAMTINYVKYPIFTDS